MQNLARHIDMENRKVDPEVQKAVRAELFEAKCKILKIIKITLST